MLTFQSDIKESNFKSIYLFYGDEAYLKNSYSKQLLAAVLPNPDDMNFSKYSESDVNIKRIIDEAETLPFFSDRRVIYVRNSGFFKKADDDFNNYLETIPDYCTFVFVEDDVDKRSSAFKKTSKLGCVTSCEMPDNHQLARWIQNLCKQRNKNITEGAYNEFLMRTSASMDNMENELNKLIDYIGDKDAIELADVKAICTKQLSSQVFDMIDAVAAKQPKVVLDYYHDLLASKERAITILVLIEKQFLRLISIKNMKLEGLSNSEIASRMKLADWIVRKSLGTSRTFSLEEMESLLEEAADLEQRYKLGKIDINMAVEMLLIKYSS